MSYEIDRRAIECSRFKEKSTGKPVCLGDDNTWRCDFLAYNGDTEGYECLKLGEPIDKEFDANDNDIYYAPHDCPLWQSAPVAKEITTRTVAHRIAVKLDATGVICRMTGVPAVVGWEAHCCPFAVYDDDEDCPMCRRCGEFLVERGNHECTAWRPDGWGCPLLEHAE